MEIFVVVIVVGLVWAIWYFWRDGNQISKKMKTPHPPEGWPPIDQTKEKVAKELAVHLVGSEPEAPVTIHLPDDDDEDVEFGTARELYGYAEGQSFAIEYTDTRGKSSTRRITVWSVKPGRDGVPMLIARCHERKAQRNFRADQIFSIIDYDGEVHDDIRGYLKDNLSLDLDENYLPRGLDSAKTDTDEEKLAQDWARFRNFVRPHAVLLVSMARSDGIFSTQQLEIVENSLVRNFEEQVAPVSDEIIEKLHKYLRGFRINDGAIQSALNELIGKENRELVRLYATCQILMEADGRIDPREQELLLLISTELFGLDINQLD